MRKVIIRILKRLVILLERLITKIDNSYNGDIRYIKLPRKRHYIKLK